MSAGVAAGPSGCGGMIPAASSTWSQGIGAECADSVATESGPVFADASIVGVDTSATDAEAISAGSIEAGSTSKTGGSLSPAACTDSTAEVTAETEDSD